MDAATVRVKTPTFGTLFQNVFAAQLLLQIGWLLPQIGRLLPGIEGFFRRSGFFRRALGLNTHKFPKRSAASLTDLPGLRLHLPSCVNNGKAEQQWKGFRKRASFLKTCTVILLYVSMLFVFFFVFFCNCRPAGHLAFCYCFFF